jgi:hypothetical protein
VTPLKAEYINADHLPFFVFRLQLCGGPYIPIMRFSELGRQNLAVSLGKPLRWQFIESKHRRGLTMRETEVQIGNSG